MNITITHTQVLAIAKTVIGKLEKQELSVAISIVNQYCHPVYRLNMDGTTTMNANEANSLAVISANSGILSQNVERLANSGVLAIATLGVKASELTLWPGGVPIYQDGTLVGAVGISAVADTDDAQEIAVSIVIESIQACHFSVGKDMNLRQKKR